MRHRTWALIALFIWTTGFFGSCWRVPRNSSWTPDQNRAMAYSEKIDRALDLHNAAHDVLLELAKLQVSDVRAIASGTRNEAPRGMTREQWQNIRPLLQGSSKSINYCRDVWLAFAAGEPLVVDGEIVDEEVTLDDVRRSWISALRVFVDFLTRSEALGADVRIALTFARAQLMAVEEIL